VRFTGGRLEYFTDAAELPALKREFPAPNGLRSVLGGFTMADVVTIPTHLRVAEVRTYSSVEAAADVAAPNTVSPVAVDELGRSAQTFVVDVVVRSGDKQRRLTASGQDIYAVSAPLAVEAVDRILTGRARRSGVASAGEMFDAPNFLRALGDHLAIEPPEVRGAAAMPAMPAMAS
jgi:hypothetical protein